MGRKHRNKRKKKKYCQHRYACAGHPPLMFHSFHLGTSQGGGAAAGTSPCCPPQPVQGSLFTLCSVPSVKPKPETPSFCLLSQISECPLLSMAGSALRLQKLLGRGYIGAADFYKEGKSPPPSLRARSCQLCVPLLLPLEGSLQPILLPWYS